MTKFIKVIFLLIILGHSSTILSGESEKIKVKISPYDGELVLYYNTMFVPSFRGLKFPSRPEIKIESVNAELTCVTNGKVVFDLSMGQYVENFYGPTVSATAPISSNQVTRFGAMNPRQENDPEIRRFSQSWRYYPENYNEIRITYRLERPLTLQTKSTYAFCSEYVSAQVSIVNYLGEKILIPKRLLSEEPWTVSVDHPGESAEFNLSSPEKFLHAIYINEKALSYYFVSAADLR